nr:sulfite exporter TauE/SafE family protein [Butyricicoccus faecihominis]
MATGVLSGFGIGGGSLLLLYLTLFAGVSQYRAGGINLLYFVACAPAALVSHIKNKLVEWQAVKWGVIAGVPASILAAFGAAMIDVRWLRRLFGVFLLYVGCKELFTKRKKSGTPPE